MRKLLRSPLAVILMVLLAAGIVYNNVIAPLQRKPVFTAPVDDPALYTITPIEKSQYNTLVWQMRDTDRNPFAKEKKPVTSQEINGDFPHKVAKKTKKHLRLSAILSDAQAPLALISGQLVGLHDSIDGFTVISIQQNRVQLQRKNTHKTLFLPQDSRR